MKLTDAEKCANLGTIKLKQKSMSKEGTFGMGNHRELSVVEDSMEFPYGMGL